MKDDTRFNKWFNAFILLGMTAALIITTLIKAGNSQTGLWLLLISAFGSLMGVLSTVCSANGQIITFLFGLLDVSIYGVMCLVSWKNGSSGLGNAILHFLYFVPMQFVGYYQWKHRGAGGSSKVEARRLTSSQRWLVSGIFIVGTLIAYLVLLKFDRSSAEGFLRVAVVLDVLPLMCNVLGQYLMSTAYMEQWILWIGVNIFSIAMWVSNYSGSGDSYALIYIIKYAFYLLNSLNGLRIWLNMSRAK